jgi:23S rRNA pseudouridine1911/1915/1917 synthase
LHAASLGFKHPRTGQPIHFEAALPADMQALIDAVEVNLSGG